MSHYFEIWLRGYAKDHLREMSSQDPQSFHPHITLVRPFTPRASDAVIKQKVAELFRGTSPLPFTLEGRDNFDGKFLYVPVVQDGRLLALDKDLELLLQGDVTFKKKLDDQKNLHATVDIGYEISSCETVEQRMLRLTGIRDDKIWFSLDFVTGEILNREQSLDKKRWLRTVQRQEIQSGEVATRNGFVNIN